MNDNGYVMAMGGCASCGEVFSFNPLKVPSIWINGAREPLCLSCMTAANDVRVSQGCSPHSIHPDAYEPLPAGELS